MGREHARRPLTAAIDFERLATAPPVWDDVLFWTFHKVVGGVMRVALRLRVEGAPPPTGGCVLVANHTSFLDPILLGAAVRRRVVFLMTETVWRSPRFGWFYRWNRAIPLGTRGGNRDALRAARQVLGQGRIVGVFPEGGLSRDGLPMLGNPGAVSLVLDEGLPIVPVGIVGAFDVLPAGAPRPRLRRVTIRFGEPLRSDELEAPGVDRRQRLRVATTRIMQRIAALTGHTAREDVLAQARDANGSLPASPSR